MKFIKNIDSNSYGWFGEKIVALILSSLPESEHKVLSNVMLQTEYVTTQIDHVIDHSLLYEKLKSYTHWAKITESTWFIKTIKLCVDVKDELRKVMDSNDRLFVGKLSGEVFEVLKEFKSGYHLSKNGLYTLIGKGLEIFCY